MKSFPIVILGGGIVIGSGFIGMEVASVVPGVWAAGDIANYPDQIFHRRRRVEQWDNAVEQGRVAMRNLKSLDTTFGRQE